jgi:hypothetical protein
VGRAEVLLIGGRSAAGKTTVGWEVAARLRAAEIPHRRLTYTNTLSVMPDAIASERLTGRELGSELQDGLKASVYKARLLDEHAPADTVRVVTDGRPVMDIAREVLAATGWI